MEVKTNGYGYVIKKANSSYGLSSTTKTPSNGTQTHVYQSGYNGYQSFRLVDLGGGYYHWKFYEDTSKCLTVPLGGSVARPYLSDCNSSSSAQKLRLLQDSSNSSAKYFATLLAGYSTNSDGVLGLITGHSWVATSRFVKTVNSTSVVGGSVIRQSVEWTRDDSTINTFSTWPNSLTPLNPLDIVEKDVAYDLSTFKNYLNGARNYNDATRTVEISKAKYDNTTLNYDSIMGCSRYLIPSANAPGNCVCTTGALRMWKNLTNEDFTSLLYPKDVRNSIISTNQLQQKDQFDLPPL
ncbi:hypothetical protein HC766_03330 [Candidatus Gracilibacteria bacterium]|nr:hypothetical protein [Candidatus Gracilibacteria bacterium]